MFRQLVESQPSWFSTMKEKLSPSSILDKIRGSQQLFIEMGICLSAGFLIGFLLKRFAAYVAVFVLFIAVIFVFQHFELIDININWSKIPELIGVQPETDGSSMASLYFAWMKQNVWLVLSFAVGFLFGLNIG